MKLEELARQSSADARTSVARLEPPSIDEPRRSPAWAPVLAGAAVVALVVGGIVLLARDDDQESIPADSLPTVTELPRLGLTLEGWTMTAALDMADVAGDGSADMRFTYYGTPDADDPFADGDLLVAVGPSSDGQAQDGESVDVRGTVGSVSTEDLSLPTTTLTWTEPNDTDDELEVTLASHAFDRARLVAIAEALEIDVAGRSVTPGPDLALTPVATTDTVPFGGMRGAASEGSLVVYQRAGEESYLMLSVTRADLGDETIAARWWSSSVTDVSVGELDGIEVTYEFDDSSEPAPSVLWSPAPGAVASLTAVGAEPSFDLAGVAATTFEFDDEAWTAAVDTAGDGASPASSLDEVYGEGGGEIDGTSYSWAIGVRDGQFCSEFRTGNEWTGSCQDRSQVDVPRRTARTVDNQFGPTVASIVIVGDPAVESVRETTGAYAVERVDTDDAAWFVAVGPAEVQPFFDVIVDGEVVATLEAAVEAVADEFAVDAIELPGELSGEELRALYPLSAELGIERLAPITEAFSGDSSAHWIVGRSEDEVCVLVTGDIESGGCAAERDITALPAQPWVDGNDLTLVVVADQPACVTSTALSGADSSSFSSIGTDTETVIELLTGDPAATLTFEDPMTGETVLAMTLADGSADWPDDACHG